MFDWMGRYAPFVSALIQHSNIIAKAANRREKVYEELMLSNNEWQVLEMIVESRGQNDRMIRFADQLGIPQSTFSKIITRLCQIGLVEKYQTASNRKNVVLKPTTAALQAYEHRTRQAGEQFFKRFFETMDGFSDEELERLTRALQLLNEDIQANEQKKRKMAN